VQLVEAAGGGADVVARVELDCRLEPAVDRLRLQRTHQRVAGELAVDLALSDFVYAIDGGRMIAAGTPADMRVDPVGRSYLGAAG
jgi:ABC-type branched-subunit amino acid transport system ATPase component